MFKKAVSIAGFLIVVMLIFSFSSAEADWSFNGGSLSCDGFWAQNVDTDGTTVCTIRGPQLTDGSYGNFSVSVWCANPNSPGAISPPKVIDVTFVSGSESNVNGRKVQGKVNLTINIDTGAAIDSGVCDQGSSDPGGEGQWVIAKVLPSSPFSGILTTTRNNGNVREEIYGCGSPTLFANGTNMPDRVDEITQALSNGVPLSSLDLEYNCALVSAN